MIRNSRKGYEVDLDDIDSADEITDKINVSKQLLFLVIGLVGLYFGSNWLIEGASDIAEYFGLSKHVIGITVIAFGTSVPELVTSVVAAFKKETDISVGNLIGSNIFNIMIVLGLTGIVQPIGVEANVISWDLLWMLGIAILLLPMMVFRRKVGRFSGAILLLIYISYIYSLF